MFRFVFAIMAIFSLSTGFALADPDIHSIAKWNIYDPTLYGTVKGNVTFAGVILFQDPPDGNNSQQVATTEWVNKAIAEHGSSGGTVSGDYCATSGCTFSANGVSVPVTPFNFQGYTALGFGNTMIMLRNSDGSQNIGIGYSDDNGNWPAFLLKYASLIIDKRLYFSTQEQPSSSTESCRQGNVMFGSGYIYYCIADGNWGRIPWQTGW